MVRVVERIEIELPRLLSRWIRAVARELGMTPSQLIANMIYNYYEVWKLGVDGRVKEEDVLGSEEEVEPAGKPLRVE